MVDVLFGRAGDPPQPQVTPTDATSWREHQRGAELGGED
jgi:hypothetical protein